jgi:hypothetical protein
MKTLLASGLFSALAISAFAQGQIVLDNNQNTNTSYTATSGGLFFLGNQPIAQDFNVAFYGGSDSANLSLLASFFGAAAAGDTAAGPGTFTDLSGQFFSVPGVPSGNGWFRIEAWLGPATSFNAAIVSGSPGCFAVFQNPVADPTVAPPQTPPDFVNMPAIDIYCIPEPSAFALAGVGAASLLIFRREK